MRRLALLLAGLAVPCPAWGRDTWTDPHPGIRQLVRTATGPRRIFALQIDLCNRGIAIRATRSGERAQTVSSFASDVGADAAVNGDFFSYEDHHTSGLAIGDGQTWPGSHDTRSAGFTAFGRGRADVFAPSAVVDPPEAWMREVVSGHPGLVHDGEAIDQDSGDLCTTRHPRTSAGLSRDRRTLILAVVDGRSDRSIGMRCTELADLMVELGAWDATNLDGGGSSTMWVRGSGVLNDPSDGSQRVVGNHLAVLAGGGAEPGSCDRSWEEAAVHGDAYRSSTTTDIDGDGDADVCARAGAGIRCAISDGGSFGATITGPALDDDSGWDDETNWATLRMGDLDGDGRADLCARANAGIRCWLSDGAGFPVPIVGPDLSDDHGWAKPEYYGTLRLADVTGDGKDDLCARSSADFRCYPSNGAGFDAPIVLADLANENGWDQPSRYGTLRMGDVDGDGRADLCGRTAEGMRCWRSTGDGFAPPIDGPAWSDDLGWAALPYWSTIRLADVDGDGRDDLCARSSVGLTCAMSTGDGFAAPIAGPGWSDEHGWGDYDNYSTIRMGDLDGDGALDVCARANAGIRCFLFQGGGFATEAIVGPALSDDAGWAPIRFASTIHLADLDGDGMADLCARGEAGVRCWRFDGAAFSAQEIVGPDWTDESGWGGTPYHESIRIVAPPPRDDVDPEPSSADAGVPVESVDDGTDAGWSGGYPGPQGGCTCRTTPGAPIPWLSLAALGLALKKRGRS